jgi:hypothetical protein
MPHDLDPARTEHMVSTVLPAGYKNLVTLVVTLPALADTLID